MSWVVSEKKHRGEMVKVAIAVLGLAVLLGVVAGIEEAFKFDTWTLNEKQQVIEQDISDEVDLDDGEAFNYDIYTDAGEDFRDEDVVAKKYGYECFAVEHSSLHQTPTLDTSVRRDGNI